MLNIDFKITTWERVNVPIEHKDKVLEALKSGEVETANDLIEFLAEASYSGVLDEVNGQMTPEDNGGASTIDVLTDEGDSIWNNATI